MNSDANLKDLAAFDFLQRECRGNVIVVVMVGAGVISVVIMVRVIVMAVAMTVAEQILEEMADLVEEISHCTTVMMMVSSMVVMIMVIVVVVRFVKFFKFVIFTHATTAVLVFPFDKSVYLVIVEFGHGMITFRPGGHVGDDVEFCFGGAHVGLAHGFVSVLTFLCGE